MQGVKGFGFVRADFPHGGRLVYKKTAQLTAQFKCQLRQDIELFIYQLRSYLDMMNRYSLVKFGNGFKRPLLQF